MKKNDDDLPHSTRVKLVPTHWTTAEGDSARCLVRQRSKTDGAEPQWTSQECHKESMEQGVKGLFYHFARPFLLWCRPLLVIV